MANHELRSMDIIIDSRDIDIAERKLRSLDRMLLQTRRRALALGNTRMRPSITLEDRFTETAIRLSATMKRLNQAAARPVAELIDLATPKIAEIRGALQELSRTRWRVEVEGAAWGAVIGGSFDEWMGAEGQSTLQRISATLGEALGSGLRGFILDALGLGESKEVRYERVVDYLENNPVVEESLYAEAGRKAGEEFFHAFLGAFDPEQISGKLCDLPGSGAEGTGFLELMYNGLNSLDQLGNELGKSAFYGEMDDQIKKLIPGLSEFLDDSNVSGNPLKRFGKTILGELPIIESIIDGYKIYKAEPGIERAEVIGGVVGSTILGSVGSAVGRRYGGKPGELILGYVGDKAGEYIGKKAGIGIFNIAYAETEEERAEATGEFIGWAAGGLAGFFSPFKNLIPEEILPENLSPILKDALTGELLSEEKGSYYGGIATKYIYNHFNPKREEPEDIQLINNPLHTPTAPLPPVSAPQPAPEIIVNMPPGMVQIHQQQQEIDIDSISKQVGWHVTHNISRVLINMTK